MLGIGQSVCSVARRFSFDIHFCILQKWAFLDVLFCRFYFAFFDYLSQLCDFKLFIKRWFFVCAYVLVTERLLTEIISIVIFWFSLFGNVSSVCRFLLISFNIGDL